MPTDALRTRPQAALLTLLRTCHHSHAVITLSSHSDGALEAPPATGCHRRIEDAPEGSWSSHSSVYCRSRCDRRHACPWRVDACLCAAHACRMVACTGSGGRGVLDIRLLCFPDGALFAVATEISSLLYTLCSKIQQCPQTLIP